MCITFEGAIAIAIAIFESSSLHVTYNWKFQSCQAETVKPGPFQVTLKPANFDQSSLRPQVESVKSPAAHPGRFGSQRAPMSPTPILGHWLFLQNQISHFSIYHRFHTGTLFHCSCLKLDLARQKTPWIYCQLRNDKTKTCGLIKGLPVCGFLNDVTKDILSMCTTLIQEQICTYNTCQMISYLISYLSWKSYIHKYCKKQQLFFHQIPVVIYFCRKCKTNVIYLTNIQIYKVKYTQIYQYI